MGDQLPVCVITEAAVNPEYRLWTPVVLLLTVL